MAPPAGEARIRSGTLVLQICDQLWSRKLLPNNFTWVGKSTEKDVGPRYALQNYENVLKLIHAVVIHYEPSASFDQVKKHVHEKICKPAKHCMGSPQRASSARTFVSKKRRVDEVNEAEAGSNDEMAVGDYVLNDEASDEEETPMDEAPEVQSDYNGQSEDDDDDTLDTSYTTGPGSILRVRPPKRST